MEISNIIIKKLGLMFAFVDHQCQLFISDNRILDFLGGAKCPPGTLLSDLFPETFGQEESIQQVLTGQIDKFTVETVGQYIPNEGQLYYNLSIFSLSDFQYPGLLVLDNVTQLAKESQQILQHRNEIKLLYEQMIHKQMELQSLNLAISQSSQKTQKAHDGKSAFLANLSHEIRNPLNAIIGLTDLILSTNLSQEQWEYAELIHTSANTLMELINDVLDLSKIEAGKFELKSHAFDLSECLQSIINMYKIRANNKNLHLEIKILEPINKTIIGDSLRFRQILLNLLGNSLKFTATGGISIAVCRDWRQLLDMSIVRPKAMTLLKKFFQVTSQSNEELLFFSITDSGIGIPEKELEGIFEDYSQTSNNKSKDFGGTGLGLAIVMKLVKLMGGDVCVESIVGKGTTFFFYLRFALPTKEGHGLTIKKSKSKNVNPGKAEKLRDRHILIAEDNLANQKLLTAMLKKMEIKPTVVQNGQEAIDYLERAAENSVDLVLMDIEMPIVNGIDATKKIRAMDRYAKLPIIALTGRALLNEKEEILQSGVDAYLSKPYIYDDLYKKIVDHI